MTPVLTVAGLSIESPAERIVRDVSFEVAPGEVVGVVGESGSGKTLTSLAIAQLLPRGLTATSDRIEVAGRELSGLSPAELRFHLGTKLGLVFQDPMSSLNPSMTIGKQLIEGTRAHERVTRAEAFDRARVALSDVHVPNPERVMKQYPHALSGGMRQRVMIAMALMHRPQLVIADEPTTALDVTVQAQVMSIMSELNREHGTAILMVSHNIALLSEICQRVLVMYRGDLVDVLTTDELLAGKGHAYTQMLVRAVPDLSTDRDEPLAMIDDIFDAGVAAHGTDL
ncbi:ABC transporter ATP-binding protein [Leucobacter chinensis]|uniref:ABC transporter ATP-binding protein n=1 Tax=Leucobacter chinensis TaxID=2851010 RepID=UPI001C22A791|nr:ABC transporter ATP-binding protein [Leucobacter chinensis]